MAMLFTNPNMLLPYYFYLDFFVPSRTPTVDLCICYVNLKKSLILHLPSSTLRQTWCRVELSITITGNRRSAAHVKRESTYASSRALVD